MKQRSRLFDAIVLVLAFNLVPIGAIQSAHAAVIGSLAHAEQSARGDRIERVQSFLARDSVRGELLGRFETTGNTVTNWGWNKWIFGSNWSAGAGCCYHDANNHVYFDEFEIFSDTGTGATGLMADDTITQDGGGGEGGSSIILFLEWIPLIVRLIWHARTWLIGAALLIGGATMTTVSLAAQKTKQLSTTATISTLNVVSSVLEKVKR